MSYLIDANINNVKVSGNTDPYTLTSTDEIFLAQDNQIVILPEPTIVNKGRTYAIKLNGSFTSGVFVRNHLSTLIYTINKDYGTVNIISDGTTWVVLADAIQVSEIATTTYVQESTWNNVGAWNGIDTYNAKDVVSYEGSSWLALQTSTNSAPVEGADWTLIASKGDQGDQGLQGDAGANGADGADGVSITSATIDINGDLLIEFSNDLGNPTNVGTVVGANGTNGADAVWYFQGAWSNLTNYVLGDIVTYQGQTWYALQANNNSAPIEGANWTLIASKGGEILGDSNTWTGTNVFQNNVSIVGGTLTFAVKDGSNNTVFSIDSNNGDTNISGDLTVTGSLIVNGSTTTINTVNLNVTDSLIQLADGVTGAPVNDAGFIIARGDENNASLFWNENSDTFIFATATSLNSDFTGDILIAGGTITYSAVRLGSLEANSISGITGGSTLSVTGDLIGNADTSSSWLNPMTLNLGGDLSGSVAFNGSSTVTLNATLGTVSIANLEYSSINIGGSNISLGGTINLDGGLSVTGSTLSVGNVATSSSWLNAMTLSIGGTILTGSISFNGSSPVTLLADVVPNSITGGMIANATITNSNLINDSINIDGVDFSLGSTLNVAGDSYITLGVTGTTLSASLSTIDNAILENDSVRIGSYDLALGGTLNLSDLAITGSTLGLNIGNAVITNNNLVNDSVSIGGSYSLALGGTLNLENLTTTGSTLSLATTINLTDEAANALEFAEGANTYLKFITTGGAEEVYLGKPLSLSQINLTDNQATALDITEGANSYLKFDTTDTAEKIQASKTLEVKGGNLTIKDSTGNTTLYTFNNLLSSASVTTKSSLDIQTFGGVSKFNVDNTTGNTTIKGVAKVENDLVAQSKAILNGNAIINGVAQFENTIIANQIKTSNDILVYDGAPATPQTLYLYVKYNNYSQSDNEYFYIYKTTDYGITREIVPLTSLANLQEDTSLGYKRYRANAGTTYNNTTNPATVNASFVVDSNYTYYLTIRTNLDDSGLPKDFQAYISTSNSENNPTYNDLLILDDSSSHTTDWKITAGSSSWGIAYLLSSSSISDRATTPSSPNLKFDVDSTTGVATLGTNASLKVNKATSASSPLIILNSDTTLTAHQDAVISVERGSGTDAQLKWDNTNTLWSADNATGTARPLFLHSPVDTSITTSTPVSLTGNAKGEYEKIYLVANSNTAITINLFALGSNYDGYKVIIKKIDSGTGAITISPNGTDNIDGANSSISISIAYGSVTLLAQGSNWWVI